MNMFDIISKILKKIGDGVTNNVYMASHQIYNNHFIQSFVGILLIFWVLSKLKGWERKDTYTIFIYASTYIVVLSLLNNKEVYFFVLQIFDLPKMIFNGIVAVVIGSENTDPFKTIEIIQNSLMAINLDVGSFWNGFNLRNVYYMEFF